MDETPDNTSDDFELNDEIEQSQPVAVAPSPALNGHRPSTPNVIGRTIVEKFASDSHVPSMTTGNNLMGRINNRPTYAPEKQKQKDDREFMDAFNLRADAGEYQLQCTRYQPSVTADGDPIPTGVNSKHVMSVMSYDEIQQNIIDVWGGGAYRVTFLEENGSRAVDIQRCILVNVPTNLYPPKREKYEKTEPVRSSKTAPTGAPVDDLTEDARRRKREFDAQAEEYRCQEKIDEMEARKTEREYRKVKREKELEQMRREIMTPPVIEKSAELALLERRLDEEKRAREEALRRQDEERKEERHRYDEDRKELQRRADEDRRVMMESMTKLGESIRAVAERPEPAKDNTMATILTVMAPVLTALITRPVPPPPDNTTMFVEMQKASAEAQRSNMQIVTALMAKPADNSNEKILETVIKLTSKQDSVQQSMMQGMFTALIEKDKGQVMTQEVIMDIQDRAEKRIERLMGMGRPTHGDGGEGEGEEGYDPALGFLGNAGKALFGSLKALMDSAATNPQLMELAMKVIGSRNPTDQQLAMAAQQWEATGVPPAMMTHMPQAQLPAGYAPTNQQAIPYAPPMQHQVPQQQRTMPPPMPGQPVQVAQQQQQPVAAQQQSAIDELEGGSSGLPSNGDPEQVAPMTAEEMAEENLRDAVTQTIEIMIGESTGKPAKRVWPEHATEHWNKAFIQQIVTCPSDRERLRLIGTKCDQAIAVQMNTIWTTDPLKETMNGEQNIFVRELHRFVDMNLPRAAAVALPPEIHSAPVASAPITQ